MSPSATHTHDADWRLRYGPWALVVGGAHGLGAAWVEALSAAGLSVASVDRDSAALSAQHEALEAAGRSSLAIELDLQSRPLMPKLLDALGDRKVGLLICNAAVAHVGPFLDRPVQDHLQSLEVNCAATLELAHTFAGQLAARGRGGIVLTSSLAGFQGTAQVASYAATKAYLLVLGEALTTFADLYQRRGGIRTHSGEKRALERRCRFSTSNSWGRKPASESAGRCR